MQTEFLTERHEFIINKCVTEVIREEICDDADFDACYEMCIDQCERDVVTACLNVVLVPYSKYGSSLVRESFLSKLEQGYANRDKSRDLN